MKSLRLFGAPAILGEAGPLTGRAAQRHRLALLALLARAPGRSASRDRLMAYLWPEADAARARHLLNVSVHVLRKALGDGVLLSEGDGLRLDRRRLPVDVLDFERALRDGDALRAVRLYGGPFLDGFHLDGTPEFEKWLDAERAELAARYQGALEESAGEARAAGDTLAEVEWRRRLAAEDPYNTRYVIGLMEALEAAGDRGNALQLAREHEALLREEFAADPDPELVELARRLREEPNARGSTGAPGSSVGAASFHPSSSEGRARRPTVPAVTEPPRNGRRGSRAVAAWGAAAAAVGLLAVFAFVLGEDPGPVPRRVVVAPFENRTGSSSLEPLGRVASDWIAGGVAKADLVEAVDPSTAYRLFSEEAPRPVALRTLVRATGAGTLVTGSYHRAGDSVYLVAHIVHGGNQRVLASLDPIPTPVANPGAGLETLRSRTLGGLAGIFDARFAAVSHTAGAPPTWEAYEAFVKALDLFVRGEFAEAGDGFLAAWSRDSTFTLALAWAGFALERGARFRRADSVMVTLEGLGERLTALDLRAVEWFRALRRGDRLARYRAAREAVGLAPRSQWAVAFAEAALARNRPGEALEALEALETGEAEGRWARAWADRRDALARAHHLLGDHEAELSVAREGSRDAAADMVVQLRPLAYALAALGREAELNRLIDELLALAEQPNRNPGSLMHLAAEELRAHGYEEAAARLLDRAIRWWEPRAREIASPLQYRWVTVRLLYRADRLEECRARIEEWWGEEGVERDPFGNLAWLLGLIAAREGDREEAERHMRLLARPIPWLNAYDASGRIARRAEIAARLGDRARAVELLREALAAGLPEGLDSVHVGADLEVLRGYPPFDALVRVRG